MKTDPNLEIGSIFVGDLSYLIHKKTNASKRTATAFLTSTQMGSMKHTCASPSQFTFQGIKRYAEHATAYVIKQMRTAELAASLSAQSQAIAYE